MSDHRISFLNWVQIQLSSRNQQSLLDKLTDLQNLHQLIEHCVQEQRNCTDNSMRRFWEQRAQQRKEEFRNLVNEVRQQLRE